MSKTTCYAYFGDGKFIGWYADSFGSVRDNQPKLYSGETGNIEIITRNFNYKMSQLQTPSTLGEVIPGLGIIDRSLASDAKDLSQYQVVELRGVLCPIYDGPNPDYDEAKWNAIKEKRREVFNQESTHLSEGPSPERSKFVEEFGRRHPELQFTPDTWIYADYNEVKKWAFEEPTEFTTVISYTNE